MEREVLAPARHDGGALVCPSAAECKASAAGNDFHEGQLSHVGEHYDLSRDGQPLRVMVVGQEYGHAPGHVGLASRRQMILTNSGRNSSYYAGDGRGARNPHMRGTTTILRLLSGGQPGDDRAGEFLDLESGERVHLFDAFALVNVLLCSATAPGNSQGRSTAVMRRNCLRHFAETLSILQPTVVVLQGKGVADWTAPVFRSLEQVNELVDRVEYEGGEALRYSLSHPAARGDQRWGDRLDAPYVRALAEAVSTRA